MAKNDKKRRHVVSISQAINEKVCEEHDDDDDDDDDSLCVWLHHDVAVDQDSADDGEGEEGVGENMNCNPKKTQIFFAFKSFYLKISCF